MRSRAQFTQYSRVLRRGIAVQQLQSERRYDCKTKSNGEYHNNNKRKGRKTVR
jgi:hypothetical protein